MDSQTLLKTNLAKRIYGLDIVRAIAILTVLIGHSLEYYPQIISDIYSKIFLFDGVSIFFVLSGFLIGNILIRSFNKDSVTIKSMSKFWFNRWFRTLPPYIFVLTIIIFGSYFIGIELNPFFMGTKKVVSYYVFLQNLWWVHYGFFAESWSLTVEEWFYMITPIIIFLLTGMFRIRLKNAFVITVIVIIICSFLIRYYRYLNLQDYINQANYLDVWFRKQVVTRLDGIMFGVLGAYLSYYYSQFWVKIRYYALTFGVLLTVFYANIYETSFYLHVLKWGFEPFIILCFLPFFYSIKTGKGIIYLSITFISLISYSAYLLHYTLIKYCIIEYIDKHYFEIHNILKGLIYWALVLGLSTIMYLFLEKPSMDIRKKIKFLQK